MRYFITTDKDGYVLSIQHTNTKLDFIELDLSKYDLEGNKKYSYKLGKDELIFDEQRYLDLENRKTIKENQKEIAKLKKQLTDSDYIVARAFEEVMQLENPLTWVADVIKITIKYRAKYRQTILDRSAWRKRIEELQNK